MPVSVQPYTSNTRVPHIDSHRCANSGVSGAVALTTRSSAGIDCADSTSARRCTGAVISTRRPLICAVTRTHFIGMQRMLGGKCARTVQRH